MLNCKYKLLSLGIAAEKDPCPLCRSSGPSAVVLHIPGSISTAGASMATTPKFVCVLSRVPGGGQGSVEIIKIQYAKSQLIMLELNVNHF